MLSHGLRFFTDISLPLAGMILFGVVFISIGFRTLRGHSRAYYKKMSHLPLVEENRNE